VNTEGLYLVKYNKAQGQANVVFHLKLNVCLKNIDYLTYYTGLHVTSTNVEYLQNRRKYEDRLKLSGRKTKPVYVG